MEIFFNNGSMAMVFHILKVLEVLGPYAKKGMRNLGTEKSDDLDLGGHRKKNKV